MSEPIRVDVADGKYTVFIHGSEMAFLRHGEPWPEADKDYRWSNLVFALASELNEAQKRVEDLEEQLRVL